MLSEPCVGLIRVGVESSVFQLSDGSDGRARASGDGKKSSKVDLDIGEREKIVRDARLRDACCG